MIKEIVKKLSWRKVGVKIAEVFAFLLVLTFVLWYLGYLDGSAFVGDCLCHANMWWEFFAYPWLACLPFAILGCFFLRWLCLCFAVLTSFMSYWFAYAFFRALLEVFVDCYNKGLSAFGDDGVEFHMGILVFYLGFILYHVLLIKPSLLGRIKDKIKNRKAQ